MVSQMDAEGFGNCSDTRACEIECPQGISILSIAKMNSEYAKALIFRK
jgi:succinate dehydrogenase / fumarate reductase iron-sulfur subunit